MKRFWLVIVGLVVCSAVISAQNAPRKADYAVAPVSYKDVKISDPFWSPRLEINRTVTIPLLLGRSARGSAEGRIFEAACYSLNDKPDPELRARLDGQVDAMIQRALAVKGRWPTTGDGSFYGAGTFMEAAVAYYEVTGSRKLLDAACDLADDLDAQFGPGKRHDISNHEGVEMGLIKVYRATGNEKYWKLAKFLIDARGNKEGRTVMYGPYAQDDVPILEAPRAIGHAVRATYLYAPLTDVTALSGDARYARADERIWQDAVGKRTFLTGGIGSYRDEEDYGDDYDLPNLAAWNEVCAAYGNTLWHQKMFLLHQDGQYMDMMEHTLYNAFLVGVSQSGDRFLYQAPLKSYGDFARQASFGPNCCPPNLVRLLGQLGGLIYATGDQSLYVNLFIGSTAKVKMGAAAVTVAQETKYPWDGDIKISVQPDKPQKFAVLVRIPGWVGGQPMPGGLYRNLSDDEQRTTIKINGTPLTFTAEKGYAKIDREWKGGDTIQLTLPMPVRRVVADDRVADDRGMVALERGPLVYCAEQVDNPGGVFNLVMPDQAELKFAYRGNLLGGMGTITGKADSLGRINGGGAATSELNAVAHKDVEFTAIPYFAMANRAKGQMAVWLAHDVGKAVVAPAASIAATAKATSSSGNGTVAENYPGKNPPTIARRFYPLSQDGSGDIKAIQDGIEPVNSEDGSGTFLRLRPQEGDAAWVQYDFAKLDKVSSVEVYWKDDKQCVVSPKSWRLMYRDGNDWKPVKTLEPYGVAKDKFNKVTFEPVTTAGLRMEIQLAPKIYKTGTLGPPDGNYLQQDLTWYEGGVIEWRVNP